MVIDPFNITFYVICMCLVGIAEEILFRGIVTTNLYIKFYNKPYGVIKALLIQGVIFGLAHSINMITGGFSLGILIQIIVASALEVS